MFKKPIELPKFSNRDIQALIRIAKATETFTEAVNSKKGKAVVKEAEEYKDILKIAKTVQEADAYRDTVRSDVITRTALAEHRISTERQKLETEFSRRTSEISITAAKNSADAHDNEMLSKGLTKREAILGAREVAIEATIAEQAQIRDGLDNLVCNNQERAKQLDKREAQLTAKVNNLMNINA